MTARLDHVHIFASNLDATMRFYATMFGARVVYDTMLAGARNVRLDLGGGALHVYDQPPRSADRGLIHHLGIRTDDLDALVAHMKAHGVMFRKPISEDPAFRYVMCEAPDGVLLELYQVKPGAEWMLASRHPGR
ncbi:MAG TPA: VOC family protein [Methylomirabilota bacterium]|nr:VOC family protein [Methylomirabilota bacterium]